MKKYNMLPLLLAVIILLTGCSTHKVDNSQFNQSWANTSEIATQKETSSPSLWPDFDSMMPEEFAKAILCGNWSAFAVCKIHYYPDTGTYFYDPSYCNLDNLPDLSDISSIVYDGYDDIYEDASGCKAYTASIFANGSAYIRFDDGRSFECTYNIERITEDEIYCRLYENRTAIGHFYVYRNDTSDETMLYTLKIKFVQYGGFASMSVKK